MMVYLIAFAFTIVFINSASIFYKRYSEYKIQYKRFAANQAGADFNCVYSRDKFNSLRLNYLVFFFLSFFPLFFISAVRYGIGTDYFYTYVPVFKDILNTGTGAYSEIGFIYLNKFIQLFTDDYQWLFVVTSFIFVFVLIRVVVRYSESPVISIFVIFLSAIYFVSLNNVRQSIAVVITLSALPYLVNKKFIKYLICILVGCIFHVTALLMLVPYIFVNIKYLKKHFLAFAIILTLLLPVLCKLFVSLVSLTKYGYYFVRYNDGETTTVNIVYNLLFFLISWKVLGKQRFTNQYAYVLTVMQFFAFYVSAVSIFIKVSELITRLTFYFQVFQVLLIPYLYKEIGNKSSRQFFLIIYLLLYGAYFVYFVVLGGAHEVLPYQWIFSLKG